MSVPESWWCPHLETTPEDGEGRALCVKCGAVVIVRLTHEMFMEAWRKIGEK